jgi:hypothetical protein
VRTTSITWSNPVGAPQDRANNLAFVSAGAVVDRPVRFGLPTRREIRHLNPVLVASDPQPVVAYGAVRGDGFDLDSEGEFVGVHRGVPLFCDVQASRNDGHHCSFAEKHQANSMRRNSRCDWGFGLKTVLPLGPSVIAERFPASSSPKSAALG